LWKSRATRSRIAKPALSAPALESSPDDRHGLFPARRRRKSNARQVARDILVASPQLTSPLREITRPGNFECNKAIVSLARVAGGTILLKPRIVQFRIIQFRPRKVPYRVAMAFARRPERFPIFPFSHAGKLALLRSENLAIVVL